MKATIGEAIWFISLGIILMLFVSVQYLEKVETFEDKIIINNGFLIFMIYQCFFGILVLSQGGK